MAVAGSKRVERRKLRVADLEAFARQVAAEEWEYQKLLISQWEDDPNRVVPIWPARYVPAGDCATPPGSVVSGSDPGVCNPALTLFDPSGVSCGGAEDLPAESDCTPHEIAERRTGARRYLGVAASVERAAVDVCVSCGAADGDTGHSPATGCRSTAVAPLVSCSSTSELECACRFVFECCWTYNEADGSVELVPDLEYIRWFVGEWLLNRELGGVIIVEKSRRLIMSWVCRSLELWAMGVRRSKFVICGLNYPKAAEHVWRVAWLYRELRKRRPEFDLGKAQERGGNFGAQEMEQVILPNGSLIENLNQQGQSFQGSGYSGVVMEEFSQYANPSYMYSQARRVTEGKPGQPGGFVVAITNAWPGSDWKEIKR